MMHDGTLNCVSTVRCGHVAPSDIPLAALMHRELDICRFLTGREIVSVTAFERESRAATLLAVMDDGVVCSVEVANTLPVGTDPIDKHEVISARGLVCDRVVDTQIPQSSVYLYAETEEAYTDVDFELYGLKSDDIAAVRAAFALAKDEAMRSEARRNSVALDRIMICVAQSVKTEKRKRSEEEIWRS